MLRCYFALKFGLGAPFCCAYTPFSKDKGGELPVSFSHAGSWPVLDKLDGK